MGCLRRAIINVQIKVLLDLFRSNTCGVQGLRRSRLRVQGLRRSRAAAFKGCGVQMSVAFKCLRRSRPAAFKACGIQSLRRSNAFGVQGLRRSNVCDVQGCAFKASRSMPEAFNDI
jgi:hypothetical protein